MAEISNKRKNFIIGTIFLFIALFSITIFPLILKSYHKSFSNNSYILIEFILLAISTFFYCFSYKYYKYQIISILYAILFYFIFAQFYAVFN